MRGAKYHHHQCLHLPKFQSTLPMRGATIARGFVINASCISIHAPHAGSDRWVNQNDPRYPISIHAPHAGSEWPYPEHLTYRRFQSTLPMRGAIKIDVTKSITNTFQSTLPMRGASLAGIPPEENVRFQSTLPMRGATGPGKNLVRSEKFQSTLPMRGAIDIFE